MNIEYFVVSASIKKWHEVSLNGELEAKFQNKLENMTI